MGKIITKRPKEEYVPEVDWEQLSKVAFGTLGFIVVAVISLALAFHIARWIVRKPSPPPKVITKVVHESALTAAQNAYISQCERQEDVPDVHGNNWTCVNPH